MLNIIKKLRSKQIIISVSAILLLLIGTGTVFSYLLSKTAPVENELIPGVVSCSVQETFDGENKTDVSVKNTGNTSAYIRVAVVASWKKETDSTEIMARAPTYGVDYEMIISDPMWFKGFDGFWYYPYPVAPEESTTALIERITPLGNAPEGYSLSIEILASAIQANPTSVVKDQWGVGMNGTDLLP